MTVPPNAELLGTSTPGADPAGYMLEDSRGERVWFAGALLTFKAKAKDTTDMLSVCHVECLHGWGAPVHKHSHEGEFFWVTEGDVDILIGDTVRQATAGCTLWIPPETSHSIFVHSDRCQMVVSVVPGGFEHFFEELGVSADYPGIPSPDLPVPSVDDFVRVGMKYGWQLEAPAPRTRDDA